MYDVVYRRILMEIDKMQYILLGMFAGVVAIAVAEAVVGELA